MSDEIKNPKCSWNDVGDKPDVVRYPDFTKELEKYEGSGIYTIQNDGWLYMNGTGAWTSTTVSLNGVIIYSAQLTNTTAYQICLKTFIPVKKGDVITTYAKTSEGSSITCKVYGFR